MIGTVIILDDVLLALVLSRSQSSGSTTIVDMTILVFLKSAWNTLGTEQAAFLPPRVCSMSLQTSTMSEFDPVGIPTHKPSTQISSQSTSDRQCLDTTIMTISALPTRTPCTQRSRSGCGNGASWTKAASSPRLEVVAGSSP